MTYLDYLAKTLGINCLSDLHYISIVPEQAEDLLAVPVSRFPRGDYLEAANYLLIEVDWNGKRSAVIRNAVVQKLQRHS
ncbi:MAG: hypothetical protein ACOX6U_04440 [Oscillospiraceae bacterium]|jgi:hypothetical protein